MEYLQVEFGNGSLDAIIAIDDSQLVPIHKWPFCPIPGWTPVNMLITIQTSMEITNHGTPQAQLCPPWRIQE